MTKWIKEEKARRAMQDKLLRNQPEDTVAYTIHKSWTTWDSPRANCQDGYQVYEKVSLEEALEIMTSLESDDYAYNYKIEQIQYVTRRYILEQIEALKKFL